MNELLMEVMWASLMFAVLVVARLGLRRSISLMRQMPWSFNLLFLLTSVHAFLGPRLLVLAPSLALGVVAAILVLATLIGTRVVDIVLFDVLKKERGGRPVPVVLRGIVRWFLVAVAVFVILQALFPDLNLSVLAVSSLAMGYILGNASQDTLRNIIASLAVNAEGPFAIGHWIEVGEHCGEVVDITWRSTRIKTKAGDRVVIPNSEIAGNVVTNYSKPTVKHALMLPIGVEYGMPPDKVRRVVLGVCQRVPDVLSEPPPQVWLHEFGDFSINYVLKCFIEDFRRLEIIHSRIFDLVWYAFKREGITIPFPIRDVRTRASDRACDERCRQAALAEYREILTAVDIFSPLSEEERERLVSHVREETYTNGEVLVREGDEGRTLYVLLEGCARASVEGAFGTTVLAQFERGDFFGEMSLLTGAKRSATVTAGCDTRVAVLSDTTLRRLLESNASLAEDLSEELVKRQAAHEEQVASAAAAASTASAPPSRTMFLRRIQSFFGLG